MAELFPPELAAQARRLRLAPPRIARGLAPAEHRSAWPGAGIEFRDHRAYAPGDDLRRLDRHLWARFRRLFLRQGDDPRERPVLIALDASASMGEGARPPFDLARSLALLLAAVAVREHDPVAILPVAGGTVRWRTPGRPQRLVQRELQALSALAPAGTTGLGPALSWIAGRHRRPGLLLVLSDFFEPGGIEVLREALAQWPHELALVRIEREEDRAPPWSGSLLFQDVEGGPPLEVAIDGAALEAYHQDYADFARGIEGLAADRGAAISTLDAARPLLPQLDRLLEARILAA
jgi:uncharacterized protein (DUF58 family)